MSNFFLLPPPATRGSLTASTRQFTLSLSKYRASKTVGSNKFLKKRKNFKELLQNLNGATGGLNKKSLSVVRLRHSKKRFPQLLSPITIYTFLETKTSFLVPILVAIYF